VAAGFLVLGIIALIAMEERPLRATVIDPAGHEPSAQPAE
jgi:hypothetical protein